MDRGAFSHRESEMTERLNDNKGNNKAACVRAFLKPTSFNHEQHILHVHTS